MQAKNTHKHSKKHFFKKYSQQCLHFSLNSSTFASQNKVESFANKEVWVSG